MIELRDVDLSLGSGASRVHILRSVALAIEPGISVGIVGPSGSGKSTLLMVLGGLERPDAGTVVIADRDITRMSEDALAGFRGRTVGIVFQAFHLIPTMTALENVAVPLELAGDREAAGRARAELDRVGLTHRAGHYPAELSGGEQQRVAVARALAPAPAILLADEPTGNLDETTGSAIIELMFRAQHERGQTLVLVTHDRSLAERCDRLVRMRDGRIESGLANLGSGDAPPSRPSGLSAAARL